MVADRVRADSGLPHVSLFGAQVRNLHPQSRRQGLHVARQPEGRQERQTKQLQQHMTLYIRNQYGALRNKLVNSHPAIKGKAPSTVGHD